MAKTADSLPGVLETSQYEVGGIYECAIQIKKDCLCLIVQVAPFLSPRVPCEERIIVFIAG
jgi:hypothetical protein